MKKMKLVLEDLSIESLETSRTADGEGTVVAFGTRGGANTCDPYAATCGHVVLSCQGTCDYRCDTGQYTCDATCIDAC